MEKNISVKISQSVYSQLRSCQKKQVDGLRKSLRLLIDEAILNFLKNKK